MSNVSFRRFPYTRSIEISNDTGSTMFAVSVHTRDWGGTRTWRASGELAPGESQVLHFDRQDARFGNVWFSFSRTRGGPVEKTPAVEAHFNAYFRWLVYSARDEPYGFGRDQGNPGPAYLTGSFATEQLEEERAAVLDESRTLEATDDTSISHFFELVNRTGRMIDVLAIELLSKDADAVRVVVNTSLGADRVLDFEVAFARRRVEASRVEYRFRGEDRTVTIPFDLLGNAWFLYGTMSLWELDTGAEGDFQGRPGDAANFEAHREALPARPQVVIEPDPRPEFPDPSCQSPMRIRNAESYDVLVRYEESYRAEGPTQYCPPGERNSVQEIRLGPGAVRALGCGSYHSPNMWCAERRSFRVLSAVKAT